MIVTSDRDKIEELQRIHGIGRVIYCFDPTIIQPIDRERKDVLLVMGDVSTDIKRLLSHVSSKYKIEYSGDVLPSFIVSINTTKKDCQYILRCVCPFVLINPRADARHYITQLDMRESIVDYRDYTTLKQEFGEIYRSRKEMLEMIQNRLEKERAMWMWVQRRIQQNVEISSVGGIALDTSCISSFRGDMCHLYPWIGIVETNDKKEILSLFSSPGFLVSLEHCRALLGYDDDTLLLLDARLSVEERGGNIKTRLIPLCKKKTHIYKDFHLKTFIDNPIAINVDTEKIYVLDIETGVITIVDDIPSVPVVIVSTQKHTYNGAIIEAIQNQIPIIITRSFISLRILGDKYPLYLDDTSQDNIREFFLETDTEEIESILYGAVTCMYDIKRKMIEYKQLLEFIPE